MSRRTPRPVFLNCGVITRSTIQPAQPCAYHTLISDDRSHLTGCRLASPDLSMSHAGPEVSRPFIFARSQQPRRAWDNGEASQHSTRGVWPVGADARTIKSARQEGFEVMPTYERCLVFAA